MHKEINPQLFNLAIEFSESLGYINKDNINKPRDLVTGNSYFFFLEKQRDADEKPNTFQVSAFSFKHFSINGFGVEKNEDLNEKWQRFLFKKLGNSYEQLIENCYLDLVEKMEEWFEKKHINKIDLEKTIASIKNKYLKTLNKLYLMQNEINR